VGAVLLRRWETLKVNYIVLGAVLMLWAHTLFLLLVARNFALTRECARSADLCT
jgi:hypothetical protein